MYIEKIVLPVCCLIFNTAYVHAQDIENIETFTDAKISQKVLPKYPYTQLNSGEEGWVVVNFMVDEDGNTFEPMVLDSMGTAGFEKQALRALKDTKFTPATLSGKPVTSSHMFRYSFMIENHPHAASQAFVHRYRLFISHLEKGNQEETAKFLSQLESWGAKSLYEEAFLNLAKFNYARRYDSPESQLKYLTRALYFDDESTFETFLPKKSARELWPLLFVLQVKNNRFAEALETFKVIQKIGNNKAVQKLASAKKQIESLQKDNTRYKIAGKTDEYGYWSITLYKDEFYLDKVSSTINEIKLRCEKKFVFFKYTANMKYKVPDEYGECSMAVTGDANTTFELVQLKSR